MPPTLPQGHVTILFTDVENSSRMNDALGNALYATQLREPHFARLQACVATHNGQISGTPAGDSLMVVFQNPDDALACARQMQESLSNPPLSVKHDGVTYTVRVRIGIHTAQTQMFPQHASDYSGHDANFAARVESLGAGEQIIVHESVKQDAGAWNSYKWKDWPNRRLKSFDHPETVYELLWDGGETRGEPGARWLPEWYGGERNRYIPRADKEAEILAHFATRFPDASPVRLVTLKGFGGMGKTRLGLACALQCVGLFNGNVHFVRLEDRERTPEAVAEAVGTALKWEGEQRLPANLITSLRDTNALLLLDNYESVHCPDVQRFLRDLLHGTKNLRILLTGREAINLINVEQRVDVEGLTDPEALTLFIARAQLVRPGWKPVTPEEHDALASILRDTERIPLALELVAAGMGDDAYGSVELVAKSLAATPLPSLPDGYITSDPNERHESLTRCLDWSYNLLDPATQDGFARLGLFADTITPETAHDAAGVPDGSKLLSRLAQASLLKRVEPRTEVRYTLLRPTRAYAYDKLTAHPDALNLRHACIAYYQNLARENGGTDGRNLNNSVKRRVLEAEWRNIVGAIEDAERLQEWYVVHDIAANLTAYLGLRGLWWESVHIGLRALSAARADNDRRNEGAALNNLGNTYQNQGRWEEALDCYNRDLEICREFDDQAGEGQTLNNLGVVYEEQGHSEKAISFCEQSLVIRRKLNDRTGEGQTLNNLGLSYRRQERWEEGLACYEQSLVICQEFDDAVGEGLALNNIGLLYSDQRRWEKAIACYEQGLVILRELGDRISEGKTLENVALLYAAQGDKATALYWERQALQVLETTQDTLTIARARNVIAVLELP